MTYRSIPAVVLAVTALMAFATARPGNLDAQTVPFGKNKIQYENFEWHVLSGEHLDVYYYPEEEEVARLALAWGEESYRFLERKFQHHPFKRIPLIVYSSDTHFEQTNVFPGHIPEGVLGFTEYLKRRVALPFRGDYEQFRSTLRHELVHAFQLSKLSETTRLQGRTRGVSPQRIHAWTEGLAEFWSGDQTSEDDMYVRDLVINGRLPSIREFMQSYTFYSYPLGAELHHYLTGRFGDEYIVRMYEEYWKYDSFERALQGILGVDLDRLSREWRYSLEQRFFPAYAERPPLDVGAEPLVTEGRGNFKPLVHAQGPDTTLYFLSSRTGHTNVYSMRLGRERSADVVLAGERSAEFESFHAYESAFDVRDGNVLAISSRFLDRDALLIWDINRRAVVGRYQWPDIVGVRSPRFSPDGDRVAFAGLTTAGFADLFVLDFATQQLHRMTSDRYRVEDPDWSPDGRSIVFASDRSEFGPDGSTNLVLIDVDTRAMRYITWGQWRDRAPRWSAAGDWIAFSSDRDGAPDLYVVDRNGDGHRVTELTGGALDPSWMPDGRGLVFAGFHDGAYRIYRQLLDEVRDGALIALDPAAHAGASNGIDPPTAWDWADLDAPVVASATGQPYNTWQKMSLDFAAADAMLAPGLGAAQGAQFLATDMLGNHIVFLGVSAFQAGDLSQLIDSFSGTALYLNLSHRLNYGVGVYRVKGLFRDVAWDIYEDASYGGFFIASYPLSRYRRVELQLGLARSDRVDVEDAFDLGIIGGDTRPDPRDLTRSGFLTTNHISFVKDNTLWLPTGPIDGERFNVSVGMVSCFVCDAPSAVTGENVRRSAAAENYAIWADYRRYFRTSLLSAYSIRGFGYYSDGAIPGRAVLGGTHQLRGYPRFSLAGSRVWLVNQEWRFPLLHGLAFGFPIGTLRLPGVQGAFFADAGSSWLEGQPAAPIWGSYGTSFRMSLGAPLVLRLDVGRRFRNGDLPPVRFGRDRTFNDTFVDFFFGFNF
ncbi:basic secretory protein-like protein [soil metagenome]